MDRDAADRPHHEEAMFFFPIHTNLVAFILKVLKVLHFRLIERRFETYVSRSGTLLPA